MATTTYRQRFATVMRNALRRSAPRAAATAALTFCAVAGGGIIFLAGGNPFVLPALCVAVIFLLLLSRHMEILIYLLLAISLLLEQFQIFGIDNLLALKIPIYLNLSLITGVDALAMNPIELLLGLTIGIWFIRATVSREWSLRRIPNAGMAFVFLCMLVGFVAYGLGTGGVFTVALWEVRALFYLCATYFITPQLIRTRPQIRACIWIIIVTVAIKGLQGCWRFFVSLEGSLGDVPAITGHEDALFMDTVFVLMIAMFFLHVYGRQFWAMVLTFPPTFLTFLITQRRIAYGTLVFSAIIVIAFMSRRTQLLAAKLAIPLVFVVMLYAGAFWNSSSTIALPIQQVRSIFEEGENEDSSNTYRKVENFNLEQTIRRHPLGVGFGNKYLIIMPLDEVDFPLWDYIPHNCIYWMWAKTGFIGFIVFWLFFGSCICQTLMDYRKFSDPYFKAVALMVATFIFSQVVVAYYDLQITFYRNMIYLGICMGLPATMRHVEGIDNTESRSV